MQSESVLTEVEKQKTGKYIVFAEDFAPISADRTHLRRPHSKDLFGPISQISDSAPALLHLPRCGRGSFGCARRLQVAAVLHAAEEQRRADHEAEPLPEPLGGPFPEIR